MLFQATLYGILMLLPQSKSFDVLLKRLSVIPSTPVQEVQLNCDEAHLFQKLKIAHTTSAQSRDLK